MSKIEELIKEAYKRARSQMMPKKRMMRPSDEELACYAAGLLDEKEKNRILSYMTQQADNEELLRYSLLFGIDAAASAAESVPQPVADRAKQLVTKPGREDVILEALIEFAGDVGAVLSTTGKILAGAAADGMAPALAFRAAELGVEKKVIEISKTVNDRMVDIRIEKIEKDMVNLTVNIKNIRSRMPLSGERVNIVLGNRELVSSLTENGKVVFANLKLKDYRINLIHKGESRCIAALSLKTATA